MTTPSERSPSEPARPALHSTLRRRLGDSLRRVSFERSLTPRSCTHPTDDILPAAAAQSCPSCASEGIDWLKLRMCLTCGSVGCCDSSKGRHAAGHFERTGHPLMRSIEPGETWGWCYVDKAYLALGDA